ncbi:hypothetical protein D3C75_956890 [compost metagenome]
MSVVLVRAGSCSSWLTPPMMVSMLRWVCTASALAWALTCSASSRVGVRISMRHGPGLRRGKSSRCCMAGSRKAAVLPVPVGADARISRPSRAGSSTIC